MFIKREGIMLHKYIVLLTFVAVITSLSFAQTATEYYNLGVEATQKKDIRTALNFYEIAFQKDHSNLQYFLKITQSYLNLAYEDKNALSNYLNKFHESFNDLLKKNSEFEIYFRLSFAFYIATYYLPAELFNGKKNVTTILNNINLIEEQSLEFSNRAYDLCPKDSSYRLSEIYSFLANYYASDNVKLKNFQKAINYYYNAINLYNESNNNNPYYLSNLYFGLANSYNSIGNYNDAMKNIDSAKSILPNNQQTLYFEKIIRKNYVIDSIKKRNPDWEVIILNNGAELISGNENLLYLYNPASLKPIYKGVYRVWIKKVVCPIGEDKATIVSNLFNNQNAYRNYQESKIFIEFNNNNYTFNILEAIDYDSDGSVIHDFKYNDQPSNLIPDSIIEKIFLFLQNKE